MDILENKKSSVNRLSDVDLINIVDIKLGFYKQHEKEIGTIYFEYKERPHCYESKAFDTLEYYSGMTDILITTATETETYMLHKHLTALSNETFCVRIFADDIEYYFAMLGKYCIAHVQSKTGSHSVGGTYYVIGKAIEQLRPKLILSLGIAFGVNPEKQRVGDILLPTQIASSGFGKMTSDGLKIKDPEFLKTDVYFFLRFKAFAPKIVASGIDVHDGILVTMDYVVDDHEYKQGILEPFKSFNVVGGEMEALGVYRRTKEKENEGLKCITVKAVCDYAEGKNALSDNPEENELIKDGIQLKAMENVCLLAHALFEDESVFSDINKYSKSERLEPNINNLPSSTKNNLPLRNPDFEGRIENLNTIRETFNKCNDKTITIQAIRGLGGVGKTQLVLEYAHRHINDYYAVCWINASDQTSFNNSAYSFAKIAGIEEKKDDIKIVLLNWLGTNHNWLVVF